MTKGRRKPSFQAVEKPEAFFDSLVPLFGHWGNPSALPG